MIQTLVVPLIDPARDPDGASAMALPVATALLERLAPDVETILVSILDLPAEATATGEQRLLYPDEALPNAPAGYLQRSREHIDQMVVEQREWLSSVVATFPIDQVRAEVRYGDPAAALVDFVTRLDHPLVVMASHARVGVRRLILGSVASAMVTGADCPVVIVPVSAGKQASASTLHRILVPLDGSALAEETLDALNTLRRDDLTIDLVQVVEPPGSILSGRDDDTVAAERELAGHYLATIAGRLNESGFDTRWSVRLGDPIDELRNAANEMSTDLIAMATRGAGGLRRKLLGSVAERIVHESDIPVLLVRPAAEA